MRLTHESGRHTASAWLNLSFFSPHQPTAPATEMTVDELNYHQREVHQELRDTVHLAIQNGCYDAADWIARRPILNDTLSSEVTGRLVGMRAV